MTPDKTIKRPYSINAYDPAWPARFQEIKKQIESIFGSKALSVEHVGSTSIPGMKAKPIIDTLITIDHMEPLEKEKSAMINLGYQWGENYIEPDSMLFYKTNEDGSKTENIHVCVKGSGKNTQFIVMRDYFRAHPEHAATYWKLKERLVAEFPDDYPAYRAGKKGLLDDMEKLAMDWRNAN